MSKKYISKPDYEILKSTGILVPRYKNSQDYKVGKEYTVYINEVIKVRCTQDCPTAIHLIL
jgi:hypothetical protein